MRRGVSISLLAPDLFADNLNSGRLKILIEETKVFKVEYTAAYLPGVDVSILPEVAALAKEESWFLGSPQVRAKSFGSEAIMPPPRRP